MPGPDAVGHRPTAVPIEPPQIPVRGAEGQPPQPPPAQLTDGVDRPSGVAPPQHGRPPVGRALQGAVEAYREGGQGALDRWLSSHPRERSALARLSEGQLLERIPAELARQGEDGLLDRMGRNTLRARSMAGGLVENLREAVREHIRRDAVRRTDQAIGQLEQVRTMAPLLVERYRSAQPGTGDARMAELLAIRGDAGDAGRVREHLDAAIAHLRQFRGHLSGGTWEPRDFTRSLDRARLSLDIASAPEGSVAWDAIAPSRSARAANETTDTASNALLLMDVAQGIAATSTAEFLAGIAPPIALALLTRELVGAIEQAVEANQASRRATGASMGL